MKTRLLLMVPVLSCGIVSAERPDDVLAWSGDTIVATPQNLIVDSGSPVFANVGRASSLRANKRGVMVADASDDRIHVQDFADSVVRSFGRRGRGPGELLGVSHIALRDTTVLIGDARNGRISEFTWSGRFVTTYAAGFAAGSIAADDRHVLSASHSETFYASLLSVSGPPANALRRPKHRGADSRRWARLPGHDLIVTHSSGTWVFDQGTGGLCRYHQPDSEPVCRWLPHDILQRLRLYRDERVERLERAIQMRVSAAPLVKDFIAAGHGLALLLPLADLPVLLFDPTDAALTPVVMMRRADAWVRTARSMAFDGRDFLLIGDDGFGLLSLSSHNLSSR